MIQQFFQVMSEIEAETPQIVGYLFHLAFVRKVGVYLMREVYAFAFGTQEHLSAVHACCREISHDGLVIVGKTQHDYYAASLIFSQKTSCLAAYYESRLFLRKLCSDVRSVIKRLKWNEDRTHGVDRRHV